MFRSVMFTEILLAKMSPSESNSDLSCRSDDYSEYNYIAGIYPDFETEKAETTNSERDADDLSCDRAYTDKLLADEEWLKECERQQAEKRSVLKA